jgi:predicted exporter
MLAGFSGLVQLGIFAVVGVATAATVTYTVLPVILGRRPVRRPRMPAAPPVPRRLGRWMPLLALALGAAGTVVGWQGSVLETDLGGLTPVPRELRTTDARFRQSLGVGDARHVVLVPGDSREQALARTQAVCDRLESLADAGRIGGFDCASTYLPPPSVQRRRQEALPDREELNRRIAGAVRGLPLRAAALTPFVDDVTRSRALKPLRAADLGAGPIAEKIRGMLQAQGSRWYSLVRLSAVDADTLDALDGAAASVPGGRLVDLRRTAEKAIAGYQRAAVWHCLEGAVLILVLLAVVLRDPLRLVRVAAAAFGAVGIALAVVTMSAGTVTLFHLVSLLLTAGLGLDYALFTTQPRQHGAGARSVSICAVSTLVAFGILATSTVPVLEQIGATVFVGATAAWVLAVLVAAAEGDDGEREAEVP